MNRFRIASRELFNQYFRVDEPYDKTEAWLLDERHSEIEEILFEKMVLEAADLPGNTYGFVNPNILVKLKGTAAPAMLNREIDSGYWDYPLKEITQDSKLAFISFFDWDQLGFRDNTYVRVQVVEWQSHPETVGKHAFIEPLYVSYVKG
jgi:hypothetical protein